MSILERLCDPSLLAEMSVGEKLWGAVVVLIIGIGVCMIALVAIMYAIKLMHVIFRGKEVPEGAPAPSDAPVLPDAPEGAAVLLSPSAGTVSALNAWEGAQVRAGEVLLLLEAGGSVYEVPAPCDGTVLSFCVKAQDTVAADGALLIFREKEGN